MTFHERMNSEVTVYAIGLECEVSHYSNRRTVSGDVLAWFYWRLRLTGGSSCEVNEIDISVSRAGIPGLGGIKARGLGQGRSRGDGSIETIGARARHLPLAQHVFVLFTTERSLTTIHPERDLANNSAGHENS